MTGGSYTTCHFFCYTLKFLVIICRNRKNKSRIENKVNRKHPNIIANYILSNKNQKTTSITIN